MVLMWVLFVVKWVLPKVYAVKHKDEEIRAASRSGGIFTALSDLVLDDGGTVYGCVLTDDFHAVHVRTDIRDGRNQMRGSKYICISIKQKERQYN